MQVYDKENNAYFSIDKSEMNEIRRGCMVRIVKAKGSPNAKAKAKAPPKGKKKGDQMKPPGVPAYSKGILPNLYTVNKQTICKHWLYDNMNSGQ